MVALGVADSEIQKAGNDLGLAAEQQDLERLWGAADGLAKLIEMIEPNIDRIADYPATIELAASYRKAFPDMLAGSKLLRDSITGGDPDGVTAGSVQLARGLEAYRATRALLGPLAEQALLMKRLLVQ
ncbi:MAG: hypothetical protein A2V85_01465 [Chloroflexi bacterium RBG_16_72_14]|nr:MAG: hypothetical protein A2V85_01465 [Chloroflexi bacterium RBG_16_72_14]